MGHGVQFELIPDDFSCRIYIHSLSFCRIEITIRRYLSLRPYFFLYVDFHLIYLKTWDTTSVPIRPIDALCMENNPTSRFVSASPGVPRIKRYRFYPISRSLLLFHIG